MAALLWLLALVLAFAPAAALLWYIRHLDRYEPEPWTNIGLAFLAGCLSVIPAFFIESLMGGVNTTTFTASLWSAFIVVSLTEELCKGGLAYAFMWRKPDFNEVMDGVVYFGIAHMGFAVTENLMYIFLKANGDIISALMTGFARATTAMPLHVISGMIMGYHMGVAKFSVSPAERRRHYVEAVAIPVLLHGFYDVAAFNQPGKQIQGISDLLAVGFGSAGLYAAVVALWLFLLPRIKKAQDASPWRPQDWPSLPVNPTTCDACGSVYPLGANYCQNCASPVPPAQIS